MGRGEGPTDDLPTSAEFQMRACDSAIRLAFCLQALSLDPLKALSGILCPKTSRLVFVRSVTSAGEPFTLCVLLWVSLTCLCVAVPPRLSDMKNKTSLEGGQATLSCFVNAFPEAQMKFKKPDLDFDYTIGKHVRIVLQRVKFGSLLLLVERSVSHSWSYEVKFCFLYH